MRRVNFFPAGSVRVISMDMPQVGVRSGEPRWILFPSMEAEMIRSLRSL